MFAGVSAGAGAAAPTPGETGHSSPESEKQNHKPGHPQCYHRTQYVLPLSLIYIYIYMYTVATFSLLKKVWCSKIRFPACSEELELVLSEKLLLMIFQA